MSDTTLEVFYWQQMLANAQAAIPTPFATLKPLVYRDGNKWCALYGNNLQDGVAAFGDSPAEAEEAFNKAWAEKLG